MSQRFRADTETVEDTNTGLIWTRNAAPSMTGRPWAEAFDLVQAMNARREFGYGDWRLPNRRELLSLINHHAMQPALSQSHPFHDVWKGWYWTSTTYVGAAGYAWRIQLSGGRMFYGNKSEDSMIWPVRGASETLWATGQATCYDADGTVIPCSGTGQDGNLKTGRPWPSPRFHVRGDDIFDAMTGLVWHRRAAITESPVSWHKAKQNIDQLARKTGHAWRLPTILELESLTDCSKARPALPADSPFAQIPEANWSSTTSGYDPAWAYCLYWEKGAVGVGFKNNSDFHIWPVREDR